jgi:tetratricopeptide (TPR) repeat protein
MKRRKGRTTKNAPTENAFWHRWRSTVGWKPPVTAVLLLAAVPLYWTFISQQDINAQYALTLTLVSSIVFLWALPNWKLGLTAIFLFTQPLLLYLGNTEYGYTKAIFSLGFISLLVVVWFGEMAVRGRGHVQGTSLLWPATLLLAAMLLSLINSDSFLGNLQYVILFIYFGAFYLFLANTLLQPKDVHYLLGVLLLSAGLAALYALLQYYGVLLGAPGYSSGRSGVIISTFGNKNYLGGFLGYLFVPGLFLTVHAHSPWIRLFATGLLGLNYVTLVAISSDSAWLAVLLSLAVVLGGLWATGALEVLRAHWRWLLGLVGLMVVLTLGLLIGTVTWASDGELTLSALAQIAQRFSILGWLVPVALVGLPLSAGMIWLWQSQRRRLAWASTAALLATLTLFLISPASEGFYQGLTRVKEHSANVRVQDWWIGYEMFKAHPLVGTGVGDYKREFLTYKAQFLQTERGQYYNEKVGYIQRAAQAHNEYVQLMSELGVLGLLALAFTLFVLIRGVWRRLRSASTPELGFLVLALFAGVVAFLSDSLFSFPLHLPANALALTFLLGALESRALRGQEPSPEVSLGEQGSWISASIVLLVAFSVCVFAYRDWQADLYLDRALRLVKASQLPEDRAQARAWFEKSLRLDVAPTESLYWLGTLYAEEGDLLKGLEFLERSLPHFATETTYYQLARIYIQLARIEQIERTDAAAFQRYLQGARRHLHMIISMEAVAHIKTDALYLLALLEYLEGQVDAARARLEELAQLYPQEENIPVALAQIYRQQSLFEKAREHFEQALVIIDGKLARLQRQLAVGRQVPLDDYYRWSNDRRNLEELRAVVAEALLQLPK